MGRRQAAIDGPHQPHPGSSRPDWWPEREEISALDIPPDLDCTCETCPASSTGVHCSACDCSEGRQRELREQSARIARRYLRDR